MSLLRRLLNRAIGVPQQAGRVVVRWLKAKYDAAATTDENYRHWNNADALSANAANSPAVRKTLRERARYECANNGYAGGLVSTLGHDLIGTGARNQITLPESPEDAPVEQQESMEAAGRAARVVERSWAAWVKATGLADKLRVGVESKKRDGEFFGMMTTNEAVAHAVKLDLRPIECDQCTTPDLAWNDPLAVDGIRFDSVGNPIEYHFLKYHPGDGFAWFADYNYDRVPAQFVIHWFRSSRAGQARGVPEIAPSLPLFAFLRRYTLATINAAEFAANIAGVLETDTAPTYYNEPGDGSNPTQAFDKIAIERGTLFTAPSGFKAKSFPASQPVTNYPEFKGEIITEIGRPVHSPKNITGGNSSQYNYSSGRLDHLPYQRAIRIERNELAIKVLDRLFREWLREASVQSEDQVLRDAVQSLGLAPGWGWTWYFDGFESIDPIKDATADTIDLENGATTVMEICAARGKDGEDVMRQRARELRLAKSLGISMSGLSVSLTDEDGSTTELKKQVASETDQSSEGNDASAETDKAAAKAGDVQGTALNGAQIASLVAVCDKLAQKQYPAEAAEGIIQAAFPLMDRDLISRFIKSLDSFDAPGKPGPPTTSQPSDEQEVEEQQAAAA